MKRIGNVLLSLIVCCGMLACASCRAASFAECTRTGFALDTVVRITLYDAVDGTDGEAVLDRCFDEIERLERLFSVTVSDSDIARINAFGGAPVTVADETAELLRLCLHYAALSGGAFDVTLRPVTALWDFSAMEPSLPEAEVLEAAVKTVDYRHLTVDGTTVTLTEGGLDLGGIAKGYIADKVRALLLEQGVTTALIDLGGNIVTVGRKADGEDWRIGVKDPLNVEELYTVVQGTDVSVVTSGVYERGFTLDGVRYHHLLSPQTGMPVQNGLASVTILCQSSVQADALSTACFVLGETEAVELLKTLDDVEALFLRDDGSYYATAGLSHTLV